MPPMRAGADGGGGHRAEPAQRLAMLLLEQRDRIDVTPHLPPSPAKIRCTAYAADARGRRACDEGRIWKHTP
jgi:hypothetical protein